MIRFQFLKCWPKKCCITKKKFDSRGPLGNVKNKLLIFSEQIIVYIQKQLFNKLLIYIHRFFYNIICVRYCCMLESVPWMPPLGGISLTDIIVSIFI
jgi:hypothetical protein